MNTRLLATLPACLLTGLAPAIAADRLPEPAASQWWHKWSGETYAYFTRDDQAADAVEHYAGVSITRISTFQAANHTDTVKLGVVLDHEHPAENLIAGPSFAFIRKGASYTFGLEASRTRTRCYGEIPSDEWDEPTWLVFAQTDRLGRIEAGVTGSALNGHCVQPPNVAHNFANEDFMTVGTCPGYDTRPLVKLASPQIGGITVRVSYMPDALGTLEDEEAEESLAAAIAYENKTAGGLTWKAGLGLEHVFDTRVPEGAPDPAPAAYQAGLSITNDVWTLGLAGAMTDSDLPGEDEHALAFGAAYVLSKQWSASGELALGQYGEDGRRIDEAGLGLTVAWKAIPDRLTIDAALWTLRRTSPEAADDLVKFGLGVKTTF